MNAPSLRPAPSDFPQRCNRCWDSYSRAEWDALPIHVSPGLAADGREYSKSRETWIEWRNCLCGASLCVDLQTYDQRLEDARAALAHAEQRLGIVTAQLASIIRSYDAREAECARLQARAERAEAALHEPLELERRCLTCDQRLLQHGTHTWCERCESRESQRVRGRDACEVPHV
jgi:Zn finger protein HypA/HybF involved in hydrogenase expression